VSESCTTQPNVYEASNRWPGIDVFRIVAILAVVFIHVPPFTDAWWEGTVWGKMDWIINQSGRFAVPFFFIMAGFFFRRSLDQAAPLSVLRRYGKRIVIAFVVWSLIYAVTGMVFHGSIFGDPGLMSRNISDHPVGIALEVLFVGTRTHLFFLPALALALAIVAWAYHLRRPGWLIPIGMGLYVFGVVGGSYAATRFGIDVGFNTRNGPFFSTLHVVIGTLLVDRRTPHVMVAIGLLLVGAGMHLMEVQWLASAHGVSPFQHDYVFATPLFGLGFTWIALSLKSMRVGTFFPQVGCCTLGVYLGHILMIEFFLTFRSAPRGQAGEIIGPLVIYLATLGVVSQLAHIKRLRPILI
jgi:surface polysaccharide O-acyltransferase-like enzyme